MRKVIFVVFGGAFVFFAYEISKPKTCHFQNSKITVSTVSYGIIVETIPLNGQIQSDSSVLAEVDQMYLSCITIGLHATSEFNGDKNSLTIKEVDTILNAGRFNIRLSFNNRIPKDIRHHDGAIRMRVSLSEPFQATLLPVGGFYKDTGGEWILVVLDSNQFIRRNIKLGRKSPDYFEVLKGLQPGEKVITSAIVYERDLDFSKPLTLQDLVE